MYIKAVGYAWGIWLLIGVLCGPFLYSQRYDVTGQIRADYDI
jgi:hypothetical protein